MPTTPRGANVYRASQGVQPESQESLPEPEAGLQPQDCDCPLSNWVCFLCIYCFSPTHVAYSPSRLLQKIINTLPMLIIPLFPFKLLQQLGQNANTQPFLLTMLHLLGQNANIRPFLPTTLHP